MKANWLGSLLFVLAVAIAGCGGGGGGGGGTGSALGRLSVLADFQDATRTVPGYADTLRVTVTPPNGVTLPGGFPNPFVLTRASASRVLADLTPSVSNYVLDMEALTDGTVVGTVQRSVVVSSGEFREVDVSANLESVIDSIVVEGVASMTAGNNSQFTAFAKDASDATLFSGAGFTFTTSNPSVLSIDTDTGLATANLLGNVTVTATLSGSVMTGSLNVDIGSSGGIEISIDPPSATILINEDQQFNVTVTGAGDTSVVWSVTPVAGSGTVDGDGLYSAPGGVGVYFVEAVSVADPSAKVEALVTVNSSAFENKIVFNSNFDGELQVWMANPDGSDTERISNHTDGNNMRGLDVSHDGTRVAYEWSNATNDSFVVVHNIVSGAATHFPPPSGFAFEMGEDGTVAWNEDDTKIVVVLTNTSNGDQLISVLDTGTGLYSTIIDSAQTDDSPTWSPNGQYIVFVSDRLGPSQLFRVDADGSNVFDLTTTAGQGTVHGWTPNSQSILYNDTGLMLMDFDGSNKREIPFIGGALTAGMSPSGTSLVFAANSAIYIVDIDGTNRRRLEMHPTYQTEVTWALIAP